MLTWVTSDQFSRRDLKPMAFLVSYLKLKKKVDVLMNYYSDTYLKHGFIFRHKFGKSPYHP